MPRKPNGTRPMTSTERGREHRRRHEVGTLMGLQASWTLADDATRLTFRKWVDSVEMAYLRVGAAKLPDSAG